ncbi:MAG TPA: zinc-ribbon domain-containing protein [Oscillospiraceae bacterium]|nr:zinc-ribbon domain-containing protein [Oscillospiraceae bacterium]
MTDNIFGDLVKSLGSFMPNDDPDIKLFQAQTEISSLEHREQELFGEIGRKEFPHICEQPEYSEIVQELATLQKKLQTARSTLQKVQSEKAEQDRLEKEKLLSRTCSHCDTVNPEGVQFCQECGAKLGSSNKPVCPQCSTEYQAGTRFCGHCGSKL